ncbi:MAG: ligase-associated DNA damage response endonuclease PdeM [Ekhidna sp.]|nr:ligase-associated DNA damage response endonuclease PdeM [Ekhidna sp.]
MINCEVEIKGEVLTLLPQRGIYWAAKETLIISDLHLGKAGHFRKHGIPVSTNVHRVDLAILKSLIVEYDPKDVILLGDLFHSSENREWDHFIEFIEVFDSVQFILVEGNHDILDEYPPTLKVQKKIELEPFSFTHIKEDTADYNLSGHIHPGVSIRGRARQSITMPCFYFSDHHGVLPAFGQFTGIKKIKPMQRDLVFGIVEDRVIELT